MSYCKWNSASMEDRLYHDTEWGVPVHDDKKQFEFLMLEVMQCGLSWQLMLRKREIFRACFAGFDYDKIAAFNDDDVRRIMNTPDMIHSERKIRAVIHNARRFQAVRAEFGSFSAYLWAYSGGRTLIYESHQASGVPAFNELSEAISRDLKKRGFKYTGATVIYSHLQACGIINDHDRDCPCYKRITEQFPCIRAE